MSGAANARLIAAAPDLYAALRTADACLAAITDGDYAGSLAGREIRAALARVDGGAV